MEQELENRFAALAARIGSLELLVETLIGNEIASSAKFRDALDELYPARGISDHLPPEENETGSRHLLMLEEYLSDRLKAGRRQSLSFARRRGRAPALQVRVR